MALGDLQKALGALVVAHASGARLSRGQEESLDLHLTAEERSWLGSLVHTPGFAVTCRVQRWWRETRLRWSARLTLALLGADRAAAVLEEYLDAVPSFTLFFIPEALGFLDFVIRRRAEVPHLDAVARFERALLQTAQETSRPSDTSEQTLQLLPTREESNHSRGVIVEFAAPAERLLEAILLGETLPEADGHSYLVLVSPVVPHLWRSISPREARSYPCEADAVADGW